ncbi:hypothetical protein QL995_02540 [Pseudoalteromonas sp. APC 3358]|uniref:hypothetical protein n=1 Tax=Pseudoalteromonas sp. APC 3358 TaxID=3035176 RepID=UPI0025B329CC|nr:hypothetical protein [Pseudoalteromonas sp. APC 3358]MDN3381559.1 hypothetical protein [Pseudoalteromonas sp. APC 3358]
MNLKRLAVIAVILSFVSGCKSTPDIRDIPLSLAAKNKTLEYKKLPGVASNVVTLGTVKNALREHVSAHTGYTQCDIECGKWQTADIKLIWGKKVSLTDSEVKITYFRGDKFRTGSTYLSKVHTAFPYQIEETTESFKVNLLPAMTATAEDASDALFIPISSPVSDKTLQELLDNVLNKPGKNIDRHVYSSGSFNVEFDPASVQTSFERKLKQKPNENKSNKRVYKNSFTFNSGDMVAYVDLDIFLYRGKSKVEYRLSHPVSVSPDGTSQYDENLMGILLEHLKSVANS